MPYDGRMNFTVQSIKAIPVPERGKRERRQDFGGPNSVRGLWIDVTPAGKRAFWFRRKQAGKTYWEQLGTFPDMTIEQARERADELNRVRAKGELGQQPSGVAKEPTLMDLFDAYIIRHASKTRKTSEVMKKDFERVFVDPEKRLVDWSGKKASKITSTDVETLHRKIRDVKGPYAANRTLQLVRAVFNKAITWKLISGDNPAKGITLFEEKPRKRFLTQAEMNRLIGALNALNDDIAHERTIKDFILLSMMLGARKANIAGMRFSEITKHNKQEATWTIPDTKNGTSQAIPLTAKEIDLLERRRKVVKGDFVFPGTGAAGHLMDPKRSWKSLRESAKLEDVTIHDLRRNLGSVMASNNENVSIIKGVLNHKDMKTTINVYAHTTKAVERQARERAHEVMFAAPDEPASNVTDIRKKKRSG
jgi:integrase